MKHLYQFGLLIVLVGLMLSGPSRLPAQEALETVEPALTDPVAIVNGTPINYAALKRAQKTVPIGPPLMVEPADKTFPKEALALERLISRQLLFEAAAAQKITVDSNEVDEELTRFLRRLPGPGAYRSFLSELQMTEAGLKNELTRDLTIEAFTNQLTADIVAAPEEARRYYNNHPHLFAETAKMRFREIYLPKAEPPTIDPELEKIIAQIQKALDEEADFIGLADRYNPKGRIKNGGDRGYIRAGSLEPGLEDRLFAMEIDAISAPIETEIAVLFIKIVDKQVEQLAPFSSVKKEIENFLLAEHRQTEVLNAIEKLKKNAKIERLFPIDPEPEETEVE